MQYLRIYIYLLFFISPIIGSAQIKMGDIPPNFKLYEYYSDSTIKAIYETRNDILSGYSIEFDNNGEPVAIGKYKNNIKKGKWHYSDCTIIYYKKTSQEVYTLPYCGIGSLPRMKKFHKLVDKHLNNKK